MNLFRLLHLSPLIFVTLFQHLKKLTFLLKVFENIVETFRPIIIRFVAHQHLVEATVSGIEHVSLIEVMPSVPPIIVFIAVRQLVLLELISLISRK